MAKRKSKNANGDGTVFQLPNGKWRACVSLGRKPDGKRNRPCKTCRSRADAVQWRREMLASKDAIQVRSSLTLMEFLDTWLGHVKATHAPGTWDSYSRACENHIIPAIGRTPLSDVRPATVRAMVTELQTAGVGSRTIENAFIILRTALGLAAKEGTIPRNPCSDVAKPKHSGEEIFPFIADEARTIMEATESHRLHALVVLAFSTGMRQGELFGLEWGDIEFQAGDTRREPANCAGVVRIERQATDISGRVIVKPPKSEASRRRIELTEKCVSALLERRRRSVTEGQIANPLVFPGTRGAYLRRGTFRTRFWKPLLERLKIEYRGFHHVRHSYATLALSAGVPLPTVSQILGHARQSTTLDIYSHVLPTHQSVATESITRLFG